MTPCRISLVYVLYALTVFTSLLADGKPDKKVQDEDFKRLDALARVFFVTQAKDDQFGDTFWRASKKLADERGSGIIDAVMVLSHKWKDEENLVFVPLVSLVPRDKALEILHRYQHAKLESERDYAGEFISEFDMSDTQEAVAKYSQIK